MTAALKQTDLGGPKEVSQVAGEENFILQRIFFPFTTRPVHGIPPPAAGSAAFATYPNLGAPGLHVRPAHPPGS